MGTSNDSTARGCRLNGGVVDLRVQVGRDRVRREPLRDRGLRHLGGMDVKVSITAPCIFCVENHR
jgi:hypothetical protein